MLLGVVIFPLNLFVEEDFEKEEVVFLVFLVRQRKAASKCDVLVRGKSATR